MQSTISYCSLHYALVVCAALGLSFLGCGGGPDECVKRLGHEGFHETAAAISADIFLERADTVLIAAGVRTVEGESMDYPDILIAGPAAAALGGPTGLGAPVLLITANEIPEAVVNELTFHRPQRLVMIGGTTVISSAAEAELVDLTNAEITRIAGNDRWHTSALLSKEVFSPGVPNVVVATSNGDELAEVLAAGPAAAALNSPILLVRRDRITAEVEAELERLQPKSITIIGSTIQAKVETQLQDFTIGKVRRIEGANRYDSAALVSKAIFPPNVKETIVASGESFPDALTAGLAATATRSPLLLVEHDVIQTSVSDELTRLSPEEVTVIGTLDQVSEEIGCQAGSFQDQPTK